ncbi:hypothetical protein [Kutzneria buriramensis]|uniref:Aromatic amino acid permease n=1 Tax=Kutzneria buriramensis TaxID=1045776 RepID=A0A3E0GUY4_9PSEU|nr:hypothetical protein [Kutzneria buriramensis]REH28564.1 aromatic amino acid permease [Kutzneria buriramensis]
MWGVRTWAAIVGRVTLLVGMLFDDAGRPQLLASAVLTVVVTVVGLVRQRQSALALDE